MSEKEEPLKEPAVETKVPPPATLALPPGIQERIHEIAKEAPAADPQKLEQQMLAVFTKLTFSYSRRGPLPHPEELAAYEKVAPGSAERIIAASERQASHRISLERETVTAQIAQSGRGQHYGFITAIVCLVFAFVAVMSGHDLAGSIIGSLDLVALVTVFVLGRQAQHADLEEKARAVPPPSRHPE